MDEVVELEADHQSYGSLAIAHKQAKHLAHKADRLDQSEISPSDLYCTT